MVFAPRNRAWPLVLVTLTAVIIGVATATFLIRARGTPPPQIGGYVLPEPQPLPPVELIDGGGAPFTPKDFIGHWSFLYFGYTYCPDVCPLALIELASVRKLLATQPPGETAQYYLVSVDPGRDTPERLREYVTYFDPTFHGLTGSLEDLTRLARQTGSVFFVPEGQGADNYLVSHSSNIALLDPEGRLHAVFTSPHEPAQLASDFAKVVADYAHRR